MVAMSGERWRWWSARLAVVLAGVVVAVVLKSLWSFANQDDPKVVEQPQITAVGAAACAEMRESAAAAAVSTAAPRAQRVGAINAQNDAIVTLITRMEQLGAERLAADQPAPQWLEDWQRLVAARDAYARSLAAGKPKPLAIPTVDGASIVDRLNGSGINCRVPLVLLSP
jgi:hypothetical protein